VHIFDGVALPYTYVLHYIYFFAMVYLNRALHVRNYKYICGKWWYNYQ